MDDILVKKIPLTQDKFSLVDDVDFEYLNQWKWCLGGNGYAMRISYTPIKKTIYLHSLINNTPKGFLTDHINRNKLDNRKQNLRSANFTQSNRNVDLRKDNKSGIKGVYWHKSRNKWQANISKNNKTLYLGLFSSINEAQIVREQAERRYYG